MSLIPEAGRLNRRSEVSLRNVQRDGLRKKKIKANVYKSTTKPIKPYQAVGAPLAVYSCLCRQEMCHLHFVYDETGQANRGMANRAEPSQYETRSEHRGGTLGMGNSQAPAQ